MDEKSLAADKLKKEEFARAVYQNSQTFSDCLKAVAKDVVGAISDLDVYRRAVQFYFPGAEIEFCMKLHVNPYDLPASGIDSPKEFKTLSLLDLLG